MKPLICVLVLVSVLVVVVVKAGQLVEPDLITDREVSIYEYINMTDEQRRACYNKKGTWFISDNPYIDYQSPSEREETVYYRNKKGYLESIN